MAEIAVGTLPADVLNKLKLTPAHLARLNISELSENPDDFVFKKVSDNGANIKAAWNDDAGKWVSCVDHTLELATLPVTWVQKTKKGEDSKIPKGSIPDTFRKGRAIVGYLHLSATAAHDFHECQKRCKLDPTSIDLDCKTRWRSAKAMGDQLTHNKDAVLEMDKNPGYKKPGEVWGDNMLSFTDWDHLEQASAVLDKASVASQFLEADERVTSSSVLPMMFQLMAGSSPSEDVYFPNRARDEYNDAILNPPRVKHTDLAVEMQAAREKYHKNLKDRFDADVPLPMKQFWAIASMLDPRYKKFKFKGDRMFTDVMRSNAVKWLRAEYNQTYKGKVVAKAAQAAAGAAQAAAGPAGSSAQPYVKRRKESAASFFDESDSEASDESETVAALDEIMDYLAIPQIKSKKDSDVAAFWLEHRDRFPNLEVMARQYLGCPASSASVERLFSKVGVAYAAKRKRSNSDTIASILFAQCNLP